MGQRSEVGAEGVAARGGGPFPHCPPADGRRGSLLGLVRCSCPVGGTCQAVGELSSEIIVCHLSFFCVWCGPFWEGKETSAASRDHFSLCLI